MKLIITLSLFILAKTAFTLEPVSAGFFSNLAIGGHDSTAYHQLDTGENAMKGSQSYVVEWKGAKWRFIKEADGIKFTANPERYAPAYNGHCANALSLDEGLIKTNGRHWAIFDKKLYLFYADRGAKRWLNGDYRIYKKKADQAWSELLSKKQ